MKTTIPFLVFIVVFMFSSSIFAQSTITTNNNNNNLNTSNSTSSSTSSVITDTDTKTIVINPPPSAISPSINSNNMDLCTTGASTAVQTQILGLSKGTTVRDPNCERLKLSKTLYDMGMKVAAVSVLCQDRRVFDAMKMAGTPCPYLGQIGQPAGDQWDANPEMVPDAESKDLDGDKVDDDETKVFGVGILGILGLLLLL
jgi:hypothetical protein